MINKSKKLSFAKLKMSKQLNLALKNIPKTGMLQNADNQYVYLKIDDRFILELFPLLVYDNICLPPYFSYPYNIGAHISVIYKEEYLSHISTVKLNSLFKFDISGLYSAEVDQKRFLVLKVVSPSLERFRLTKKLTKKPVYHGCKVDFHITIANLL